ncbi:MAG: SAM-dependent DNA methyltransferase [Chloroflexi bacterium]|nr:SAM-dependent DNA methyltransferase [Chloroflexota bacterium]
MPSAQTQSTQLDDTAIEYLGNILDRHEAGDSENDIRTAFRDFALQTGIIANQNEIKTEVPPAADSIQRVDMYTRNTYIEFKRNLIVHGQVDPSYTDQLDGYLLEAAKAGWGIENGILTDGKHFLKRNIGESTLPIPPNQMRTFDRQTQGPLLREYLFDIFDTDAQNIAPSPDTLTKHLAGGSDLLKQATALLKDAHDANRDNPTVAVKRKLWQDLLEVALGQDSTGDPDTADWLFIRHTYLTTLIALILQAHFRIPIVHIADHTPAALLNGDTLHEYTNLKGVIESDLFQWSAEIGATEYIRSIARKVAQFDWSKRPDELAAILYQNTITPEERRKMGEYYTPRWLAKTIVEELITDPQNTVAMDPSCGSGTFIECLVQNIIGHSHNQYPIDTLRKLQSNVIGIDLHPVAVQLAKATWVLNSHEVINAARLADHQDDIFPPIYLGDSCNSVTSATF